MLELSPLQLLLSILILFDPCLRLHISCPVLTALLHFSISNHLSSPLLLPTLCLCLPCQGFGFSSLGIGPAFFGFDLHTFCLNFLLLGVRIVHLGFRSNLTYIHNKMINIHRWDSCYASSDNAPVLPSS